MMKSYLKWAGGKTRSIKYLLSVFPSRVDHRYVDLTSGGLSSYLAMFDDGRIKGEVLLNDAMPNLSNLHTIARARPDLILGVKNWPHDKESFYKIRDLKGNLMFETLKLFYANKRGYNGLIRYNRSKELKTTFGGGELVQRWPKDLAKRLDDFALATKHATFSSFNHFDFEPKPYDFIYIDPPYWPISDTSCFTGYSEPYGPEEQRKLLACARQWIRQTGVQVFISNSDCPKTRALYAGCYVKTLNVARTIGGLQGQTGHVARGHVNELLVKVV